MKKKERKRLFSMLFFTIIILLAILIMQPLTILQFQDYIAVLFPKGIIGIKERNLLLFIQALMLLVVIPVYILTFVFSWKYSIYHPESTYDPDLVDNRLAEFVWWGLPFVLTLIISIATWIKTKELDPFKPIPSHNKEMKIQVVALQWKWLFLYPEEKIASLNFLQFPKETPIHFEITSDAPMNSFWIPELGGQIYAMPKMRSELYLIANEAGDFRGSSANISGDGFADMYFTTRASSKEDYEHWLNDVKQSSKSLNWEEYQKLAAPGKSPPPEFYLLEDVALFDQIINKYMHPLTKKG